MTDQKITVRAPGEPPVDYVLGETPAVIGRDPSCDIRVPSQYVSRRHIKLEPRAGEIILTDLGGRNPRVRQRQRNHGQRDGAPGRQHRHRGRDYRPRRGCERRRHGGVLGPRRDGGTGRASHPGHRRRHPQRLARTGPRSRRHPLDYVH
ncbi:MAG: FHA domain-containing protein [Thermoflexaceae bacterium]|nr:FHA domain-containing protein [Thermoflexaceae bacterium]